MRVLLLLHPAARTRRGSLRPVKGQYHIQNYNQRLKVITGGRERGSGTADQTTTPTATKTAQKTATRTAKSEGGGGGGGKKINIDAARKFAGSS